MKENRLVLDRMTAFSELALCFFLGALILCCLATLQKKMIGVPLVIQGYLVPVLFGGITGLVVCLWNARLRQTNRELRYARDLLETRVKERTLALEKAVAEIKTLRGIVPICSHCKRIRDNKGEWKPFEKYIQDHSHAKFSHGICKDCLKTFYPDTNG